jgi:hypothetical protein
MHPGAQNYPFLSGAVPLLLPDVADLIRLRVAGDVKRS